MVRPQPAPGAALVGVRVDIHHTGAAVLDEKVHVDAVLTTPRAAASSLTCPHLSTSARSAMD
jgi:hypothetical protein